MSWKCVNIYFFNDEICVYRLVSLILLHETEICVTDETYGIRH